MDKYRSYILYFVTGLMSAVTLSSCGDDEEPVLQQLAAPVVMVDELAPHAMSISWEAVNGSRQYGYRIVTASGHEVDAGVTTTTSLQWDELDHNTHYIVTLVAFPQDNSFLASVDARTDVQTPFCPQTVDTEGTYASYLTADDGDSWSAYIDEDRSYDGYTENTFGIFTLNNFFNNANGSIIFTVKDDKTISILNAKGYDDNGWAMVDTGLKRTLKTLYIDESSSVFDCKNHKLTYTAKFANTEAMTDTFTW